MSTPDETPPAAEPSADTEGNTYEREWIDAITPAINAVREMLAEQSDPATLFGFRFMRVRRAFRDFSEWVIREADHDVMRMRKVMSHGEAALREQLATVMAERDEAIRIGRELSADVADREAENTRLRAALLELRATILRHCEIDAALTPKDDDQ
jgi:hypothetical protein